VPREDGVKAVYCLYYIDPMILEHGKTKYFLLFAFTFAIISGQRSNKASTKIILSLVMLISLSYINNNCNYLSISTS